MLTKEEKEFLLIPKALPTSVHQLNLRKILTKKEWDLLRKQTYQNANYECELCGKKSQRLEAHEMWVFDFEKKTQTLKKLVSLCLHCHRIQHALLLKLLDDQKKAYAQSTINHYNKLTNSNLNFYQFFALANQEAIKFENIDWEIIIF